jgi:sulfate permease, SulP family
MNRHSTDAKASQSGTAALRFDLIAGLTAAAVVLPKAMAYATVAGLPVAVGLYTAFIPMVIYALLGSSQVLSVSSTTTLAIRLERSSVWRCPTAIRRSSSRRRRP